MARVYVQLHNLPKAISLFEQSIDEHDDSGDGVWIYHDMGRCYLLLKQYEKAKEFGSISLKMANQLNDIKWKEIAQTLVDQANENLVPKMHEVLPTLPSSI
jgi:tetratricopeptide (TPR) repeat protein